MSEDRRTIYEAYSLNGSYDTLVVDESTGSINQDDPDDSKDNSSLTITIVSDDGHDGEAALIELDDAIIKLSLTKSPCLAPLRVFLRSTFQWFPETATFVEKAIWTTMQILIVGFLAFCYAFVLGAFGNISLVEEEWKETVTAAKNIIWSLRMLEMNILGVLYFQKRHLEKMLTEVILTRRYWKKIKKTISKVSLAVFLGVFVLPVGLKAVQMNLSTTNNKSFNTKQIILNNFLAILARLVALPIFFAFIHAVYIIFSQISYFKEQIQKWPGDKKEEARNWFKDIENMIRDAERSFQSFLVVHLLLLLVLLIPSIFSCAERLQDETHYNQTDTDRMKITSVAKIPENAVITNFSIDFNQNTEVVLFLKQKRFNDSYPQATPPSKHRGKTDLNELAKIGCSALGNFLEMFVLYSLPLVFLAKLHKIMTSLPEVVRGLKFSEQRENGYLFQNKQILDDMLADLSMGRGIRILGISLTAVKAALVTMLLPFLTEAIHLLFLHVDLD